MAKLALQVARRNQHGKMAVHLDKRIQDIDNSPTIHKLKSADGITSRSSSRHQSGNNGLTRSVSGSRLETGHQKSSREETLGSNSASNSPRKSTSLSGNTSFRKFPSQDGK